MHKFNRLVSSIRCRVEQAFGILKGRFPSLKLFGTPEDVEDVYRTIEALMSVHNFCIDEGDQPELIPWFNWKDPEVEEAVSMGRQNHQEEDGVDVDEAADHAAEMRRLGQEMRENIFVALFPPQ